MAFSGFGHDVVKFYMGLEADNSKSYWAANKVIFETQVQGPMKELGASVAKRYQPLVVFRPNRDVRFAKDKSPYKTGCGAVGETEGGAMVYVQVSSKGLMVASGYYMMANDQLDRYRAAVADERLGPKLEKAIAEVRASKLVVGPGGNPPLKTAPRGYPKDHPRIDLLRWKGVIGTREFGAPKWLHTSAAKGHVEKAWEACTPIVQWLDANVGPSTEMPEEFR